MWDGENGFRVPVGDIDAFVDRLSLLQRDLELRRRLSQAAYATVDSGDYRIEDMVRHYADLFQRVLRDAESRAYRRPRGKIVPPRYPM